MTQKKKRHCLIQDPLCICQGILNKTTSKWFEIARLHKDNNVIFLYLGSLDEEVGIP